MILYLKICKIDATKTGPKSTPDPYLPSAYGMTARHWPWDRCGALDQFPVQNLIVTANYRYCNLFSCEARLVHTRKLLTHAGPYCNDARESFTYRTMFPLGSQNPLSISQLLQCLWWRLPACSEGMLQLTGEQHVQGIC